MRRRPHVLDAVTFLGFVALGALSLGASGCASRADEFRKCVSAATQHNVDRAEASRIAASLSGTGGSLEHRSEDRGSYYELTPENQHTVIEQCSAFLPDRGERPVRLSSATPQGTYPMSPVPPANALRSEGAAVHAAPAALCPAGMHHEGQGCVPNDAKPGALVRIPGATMLYENRRVDVPTFDLDVTEVSVAAYKTCVDARACSLPFFQEKEFRALGRLGYRDSALSRECHWADGAIDHPINCVDYDQAAGYCAWAGKRLPTAVEMTYAAVGQTGWLYPWGNDEPPRKDPRVCTTIDHTCPVWSNPQGQSKFGVFHLADNVGEWLADVACEDGAAWPCKNVKAHHVIGGALGRVDGWQTIGTAGDNERGPQNGFRCARSVDTPPAAPR